MLLFLYQSRKPKVVDFMAELYEAVRWLFAEFALLRVIYQMTL